MIQKYDTYYIRVTSHQSVHVEFKGSNNSVPLKPGSKSLSYASHQEHLKELHKKAFQGQLKDGVHDLSALLFETLFSGGLYDHFISKKHQREDGSFLRIKLEIPEKLAEIRALPWEFTRGPEDNSQGQIDLATNPQFAFSRCPSIAENPKSIYLNSNERLRVALVISSPDDEDGKIKYKKTIATLRKLSLKYSFDLLVLVGATQTKVKQLLENQHPHIFHFIGHGSFDEDSGSNARIALNGKNPMTPDWIEAREFSSLFNSWVPPIVFFQACETGRLSLRDASLGFPPSVLNKGVSIVIAMQYSIETSQAECFAVKMYKHLIEERLPIDLAVQMGRGHLAQQRNGYVSRDFATPVIFMQTDDGDIFKEQRNKRPGAEYKTIHSGEDIERLKSELLQQETFEFLRSLPIFQNVEKRKRFFKNAPLDISLKEKIRQYINEYTYGFTKSLMDTLQELDRSEDGRHPFVAILEQTKQFLKSAEDSEYIETLLQEFETATQDPFKNHKDALEKCRNWKQKCGTSSKCRDNCERCDSVKSFIIVRAPAGYGKSMLLKKMHEEYRKDNWKVILVNLEKHGESIDTIRDAICELLNIEIKDSQTSDIRVKEELQKHYNVIFLFDQLENANFNTLLNLAEWLCNLREFLKKNKFYSILTQRNHAPWMEEKLSNAMTVDLNLFTHQTVETWLKEFFGSGPIQGHNTCIPIVTQLMEWSAGHPKSLDKLIRHFKKNNWPLLTETVSKTLLQKLLLPEFEDVMNSLGHDIPNGLLADLSFFRTISTSTVKYLIRKGRIPKDVDTFDFIQEFKQKRLFSDDATNSVILRDIIINPMKTFEPDKYMRGNKNAEAMYVLALDEHYAKEKLLETEVMYRFMREGLYHRSQQQLQKSTKDAYNDIVDHLKDTCAKVLQPEIQKNGHRFFAFIKKEKNEITLNELKKAGINLEAAFREAGLL